MAVPAFGDSASAPGVFRIARLANATPDKQGRIGIRAVCEQDAGCNVGFAIRRADTHAVLGRVYVLLLGHTTETDFVILSKKTRATLARKRTMRVVVTADVKDAAGTTRTVTKDATLRAPRRA
jgi:hypothetical protein